MLSQTFPLDVGWQTILKDMGLRPEFVLRRAGLPEDLLSRTGQSLSTTEYFRFWTALEAEAATPLFPLQLIERVSAESFTPPLFAALCSAHLMQATQRLAKYKQLVAPMALDLQVAKNGDLTLTPRWLLAEADVPYSLQVVEIGFFLRLARMATRETICAKNVVLPNLPDAPHVKRYADFFGVAMTTGTPLAITFSAADALRPFLTASEGMWNVFEPDLRRRLSQLDGTADVKERVKAVLLELLPSNAATIEAVAERLGMSKRTLQRRLESEGESFRGLVNGTRESLARHYLANTNMSGGEIAFLLGFEEPNSFYRAFHDWTGQTPDTVRNKASH